MTFFFLFLLSLYPFCVHANTWTGMWMTNTRVSHPFLSFPCCPSRSSLSRLWRRRRETFSTWIDSRVFCSAWLDRVLFFSHSLSYFTIGILCFFVLLYSLPFFFILALYPALASHNATDFDLYETNDSRTRRRDAMKSSRGVQSLSRERERESSLLKYFFPRGAAICGAGCAWKL